MSVNKAFAVGALLLTGFGAGAGTAQMLTQSSAPAPTTVVNTQGQDQVSTGTAAPAVHGTYNRTAIANKATAPAATTTTPAKGGLAKPSVTDYTSSWDATGSATDGLNNMSSDSSPYTAADDGYGALSNIAYSPYATTNEVILADTGMQADNQVNSVYSETGIDSQILTQIADSETTGTTADVLAQGGSLAMNDQNIASSSDQAIIGSVFTQSIADNADSSYTSDLANSYQDSASYTGSSTAVSYYQDLFNQVQYSGG